LELGYFGGLSQSEIAERTGQPLGTIKTRMRLAMQKLRERLSLLREETR
jgi:RNA polymerase sigma-70 factor, ECF subfamily